MGFRRARLAARSVGVVQSGPSHGAAGRLHVRAAACAGVGGAEGQGSVSWMRSVRLFTALLQLSLPGAAAWADAQLDSAGAHATAHVESHTTSACARIRSEEHTSELQSRFDLVCRLLLEKKKNNTRRSKFLIQRPFQRWHPYFRLHLRELLRVSQDPPVHEQDSSCQLK